MGDSTVRIISAADENYCLAIRGVSIVLTRRNPNDHSQNWLKRRYVPTIWDAQGHPAFVLVNTMTKEAMMKDNASSLLVPGTDRPNSKKNLWTAFSMEQGDLLVIRWFDDPNLFLTFNHDVAAEGQMMELQALQSKNTQRWKFIPPDTPLPLSTYLSQPSVRIYIGLKQNYSLTIYNNTVMVAPSNFSDKRQHWIKATTYAEHVTDQENSPSFALVNKDSGQAIKHGFGKGQLVGLAPFDPNNLDESILWTEGTAEQGGFRKIRMLNNISLVFDLFRGGESPLRVLLGLWEGLPNNVNQTWKIEEIEM